MKPEANRDEIIKKVKRIQSSGKMFAIMGYILNEEFTDPQIVGMVTTSDGFVLGMRAGDIGYNDIIGEKSDVIRHVDGFIDVARLTPEEKSYVRKLLVKKVLRSVG